MVRDTEQAAISIISLLCVAVQQDILLYSSDNDFKHMQKIGLVKLFTP